MLSNSALVGMVMFFLKKQSCVCFHNLCLPDSVHFAAEYSAAFVIVFILCTYVCLQSTCIHCTTASRTWAAMTT